MHCTSELCLHRSLLFSSSNLKIDISSHNKIKTSATNEKQTQGVCCRSTIVFSERMLFSTEPRKRSVSNAIILLIHYINDTFVAKLLLIQFDCHDVY